MKEQFLTYEQKQEIDLANLCVYDKRNPESITIDDDDDAMGNYARKNCFCDNCFYGRARLTEQLISQNNMLYTKEEVLDIVGKAIAHIGKDEQSEVWMRINYKQWLEQFKK